MKDLKKRKGSPRPGNGGARPGSGMKPGQKCQKTIAKEEAREITRQIITKHLDELIAAQIENAKGLHHLMVRDPKTGKFERATTDEQIDEALKTDNGYYLYKKDPSVQAFTDLLNRALDKPAEQMRHTGLDGGPVTIKILTGVPDAEEGE